MRQDLIAAREAVEAAREAVTVALGQYYPTVSLNVDYFLSRQSFPTNSEWSGILQASLPLFDAGIIYQNARTAWSQLRQARLTELLTSRGVDQQIQTDYDNVNASLRRVTELSTEVSAALRRPLSGQQSYAAGLATNLDVLTTQDQLLTAQLNLASEEFNHKVFYLDLLRAMGNLLRPQELIPATVPTSQPSGIDVTTPGPVRAQSQPQSPAHHPVPTPTPHDRPRPLEPRRPAAEAGLSRNSTWSLTVPDQLNYSCRCCLIQASSFCHRGSFPSATDANCRAHRRCPVPCRTPLADL